MGSGILGSTLSDKVASHDKMCQMRALFDGPRDSRLRYFSRNATDQGSHGPLKDTGRTRKRRWVPTRFGPPDVLCQGTPSSNVVSLYVSDLSDF